MVGFLKYTKIQILKMLKQDSPKQLTADTITIIIYFMDLFL